jgi:uncharacterized membrane protein
MQKMQTNGPIRDYASYASLNQRRYLHPQTSGETLDNGLHTYRLYFREIASYCLAPSALIAGFISCFSALLIPRLFQTSFLQNSRLQILEFIVILFVGIAIGFIVAGIGLAKISSICHGIADLQLKGSSSFQIDIERNSNKAFLSSFFTYIRTFWFVIFPFALSLAPIIICGFIATVTPETDALTGIAGVLSLLCIPVGAVWSLTRIGLGIGAVSVTLAENVTPKDAIKRANYLFGRKSQPAPKTNPVGTSIGNGIVIYLILRGGYSAIIGQFEIERNITGWFSNAYAKQTAELILSILPEFIAIWLIVPFIALTGALYYQQRRIVVEGLDIETLYEILPANRR